MVALLAEGVDRNFCMPRDWKEPRVALLAEGVDRNWLDKAYMHYDNGSPSSRRAWIEILYLRCLSRRFKESPSSRRAWIEMAIGSNGNRDTVVALLAEGVDRNAKGVAVMVEVYVSPSSRRAWIEISSGLPRCLRFHPCRPPRGGRG